MKILTVIGTRPEIIRMSVLIKQLDVIFGKNHILVNTQQNFKSCLNDIFMKDFEIRKPDYDLHINEPDHFKQVAKLIEGIALVFKETNPDYLIILGDTNSAFSASYVARHYRTKYSTGVPIFHMEAGNRSNDARVPEEINRSLVDHMATLNLCYTDRQKENLVAEGLALDAYVTGNPQLEILNYFRAQIESSSVLQRLNLAPHDFMLVTLHRAENVAYPERIKTVLKAFKHLAMQHDKEIVISCHPRMRDKMNEFAISDTIQRFQFIEPIGFFDLVKIQQNAFLVASDSGTVPEECTIQHIPNIILRESTERIEIIEHGSSFLAGTKDEQAIIRVANAAILKGGKWMVPKDYLVDDFSQRVIGIILHYIQGSRLHKDSHFISKHEKELLKCLPISNVQ